MILPYVDDADQEPSERIDILPLDAALASDTWMIPLLLCVCSGTAALCPYLPNVERSSVCPLVGPAQLSRGLPHLALVAHWSERLSPPALIQPWFCMPSSQAYTRAARCAACLLQPAQLAPLLTEHCPMIRNGGPLGYIEQCHHL